MIEQIKNHRVKHGNLMHGIEDLMQENKADFIYSDPPWGQGNLRYWQTMNLKMTGQEREDVEYSKFLSYFFDTIFLYAKDKCVIEYGCQWNDDIVKISEEVGFKHHGSTVCYYKSGSDLRPCDLHFLSKESNIILSDEFKNVCTKKQDLDLVEYIFNYLEIPKEGICLDPMCGMGFTAQASINRGMTFYGNELNLKRLEKTKERLRK
tara:strand:- start:657 stop:1277 length:621 start_codon:yes stop_codon:yes gene_type:complete